MIQTVLLIGVGFASLIFGASWLVDGASLLAKKYKVSDLAIGLTIVAFGTSAPELVVNIIASAKSHSDMVLGNVVGSNNFNIFIILGLSGLISPIRVRSSTAWREIPVSLLVVMGLFLLGNDFFLSDTSRISRLDGGIMFGMFLLFLYYVYAQMRREESRDNETAGKPLFHIWGLIILGLAGLGLGGQLVVNNSMVLAQTMGVSEKVIGLTIVAAGTSLPELLTSVVAALKKNSDIAIGNVIGSNVFNILLILSVSSMIRPIPYAAGFNKDLLILAGGTAFLLVSMLTGERKRLDRGEAAVLLAGYLLFMVLFLR